MNIIKIKLNSINMFEDVADYYFVCHDGDGCWIDTNSKSNRILKSKVMKSGYVQYGFMMKDKTKKYFYQHRIFALTFIPNPFNKSEVNHLDGNKQNNNLSNLSWVTPSENIRDSYDKGLNSGKSGSSNSMAKLSETQVDIIFDLRSKGFTYKAISEYIGISRQTIEQIINRRRWQKYTSKFFTS